MRASPLPKFIASLKTLFQSIPARLMLGLWLAGALVIAAGDHVK
jgi:hypothetical protein